MVEMDQVRHPYHLAHLQVVVVQLLVVENQEEQQARVVAEVAEEIREDPIRLEVQLQDQQEKLVVQILVVEVVVVLTE